MEKHILHLLNEDYYLRAHYGQLEIHKGESLIQKIPLEDIHSVVIANRKITLTGALLSEMAENGIPVILCDQRFEPSSVTLPYYRPTNTETVRAQVEASESLQTGIWKEIVKHKIQNQGLCLKRLGASGQKLEQLLGTLQDKNAGIIEARAARYYWPEYFKRVDKDTKKREAGTRNGVNGKLDYGYAIVRSAVLRELAGHGLIAALGLGHKTREHHFALADDLMEPHRPFVDVALWEFTRDGKTEHKDWIRKAAALLTRKVKMNGQQVDVAQAIQDSVRSLGRAFTEKKAERLNFPKTNDLALE